MTQTCHIVQLCHEMPGSHHRIAKARMLLCLPLLMSCLALPAQAEPDEADEQTETVSVAYDPADLVDLSRARALLRRIDGAAMQACGAIGGLSLPIQEGIERSDCRRDGILRSVASLHSPMLTRMAAELMPFTTATTEVN